MYSKKFIEISKSYQKRAFNGYHGVTGRADSEYDIVKNISFIFLVACDFNVDNSSYLEYYKELSLYRGPKARVRTQSARNLRSEQAERASIYI